MVITNYRRVYVWYVCLRVCNYADMLPGDGRLLLDYQVDASAYTIVVRIVAFFASDILWYAQRIRCRNS